MANTFMTFLQQDLNSILNETQKKSADMKEAIVNALKTIEKNQQLGQTVDFAGHGIYLYCSCVDNLKDIILPFLLCCKTKNPRLINHALAYLRRLTVHVKIQEEFIPPIVHELSVLAKSGKDYQLKVIQCFSPLFMGCSESSKAYVTKIMLSICLNLLSDTEQTNAGIIFATIRQISMDIFDQASASLNVETPQSRKEQHAVLIFKDICATLTNGSTQFLDIKDVPLFYAIEFLREALSSNTEYFIKEKRIMSTTRLTLCPFLIKEYPLITDSRIYHRFVELIYLLIKNYREGLVVEVYEFMSMFCMVVTNNSEAFWKRVTVLEKIIDLISNSDLILFLWENLSNKNSATFLTTLPDPVIPLVDDIISISNYNGIRSELSGDIKNDLISLFCPNTQTEVLDNYKKTLDDNVNESYLIYLLMNYVHNLLGSLVEIKDQHGGIPSELSKLFQSTFFKFFSRILSIPFPQTPWLKIIEDYCLITFLLWENPNCEGKGAYFEFLYRITSEELESFSKIPKNGQIPEKAVVLISIVLSLSCRSLDIFSEEDWLKVINILCLSSTSMNIHMNFFDLEAYSAIEHSDGKDQLSVPQLELTKITDLTQLSGSFDLIMVKKFTEFASFASHMAEPAILKLLNVILYLTKKKVNSAKTRASYHKTVKENEFLIELTYHIVHTGIKISKIVNKKLFNFAVVIFTSYSRGFHVGQVKNMARKFMKIILHDYLLTQDLDNEKDLLHIISSISIFGGGTEKIDEMILDSNCRGVLDLALKICNLDSKYTIYKLKALRMLLYKSNFGIYGTEILKIIILDLSSSGFNVSPNDSAQMLMTALGRTPKKNQNAILLICFDLINLILIRCKQGISSNVLADIKNILFILTMQNISTEISSNSLSLLSNIAKVLIGESRNESVNLILAISSSNLERHINKTLFNQNLEIPSTIEFDTEYTNETLAEYLRIVACCAYHCVPDVRYMAIEEFFSILRQCIDHSSNDLIEVHNVISNIFECFEELHSYSCDLNLETPNSSTKLLNQVKNMEHIQKDGFPEINKIATHKCILEKYSEAIINRSLIVYTNVSKIDSGSKLIPLLEFLLKVHGSWFLCMPAKTSMFSINCIESLLDITSEIPNMSQLLSRTYHLFMSCWEYIIVLILESGKCRRYPLFFTRFSRDNLITATNILIKIFKNFETLMVAKKIDRIIDYFLKLLKCYCISVDYAGDMETIDPLHKSIISFFSIVGDKDDKYVYILGNFAKLINILCLQSNFDSENELSMKITESTSLLGDLFSLDNYTYNDSSTGVSTTLQCNNKSNELLESVREKFTYIAVMRKIIALLASIIDKHPKAFSNVNDNMAIDILASISPLFSFNHFNDGRNFPILLLESFLVSMKIIKIIVNNICDENIMLSQTELIVEKVIYTYDSFFKIINCKYMDDRNKIPSNYIDSIIESLGETVNIFSHHGVEDEKIRELMNVIANGSLFYLKNNSSFVENEFGDAIVLGNLELRIRCFLFLSDICERNGAKDYENRIQMISGHELFVRSKDAIERFLEDLKITGNIPISCIRYQEIVFILNVLAELRIAPLSLENLFNLNDSEIVHSIKKSCVAHLYLLLPKLVEIISTTNKNDNSTLVSLTSLSPGLEQRYTEICLHSISTKCISNMWTNIGA